MKQYKNLLIEGLKAIGENTIAQKFDDNQLSVVDASSVTDDTKIVSDLKPTCIIALAAVNHLSDALQYGLGIAKGEYLIVSNQ